MESTNLECSVYRGSTQHGVKEFESRRGRFPRNQFGFFPQVTAQVQGHWIIQSTRTGQVESIVNQLSSINDWDFFYIVQELSGNKVPITLIVINAIIACF